MSDNEILEKLHSLNLVLADELKRICEKYNINYFMIAGTMLGAIRHGGFIPWDDDMDFGMLRSDFERFLDVCDKEINGNVFYLQTDRKEKYYPHNFAKLSLAGTEFKENIFDIDKMHEGIYIDIFPFDTVPDNKIKKKIQFRIFRTARSLLRIKTGYATIRMQEDRRFRLGRIVATVFPIKFLKWVKHTSISRYNGTSSKYVVNSDGAYGMENETLKRNWIENLQDYPFEDRVYPGIVEYDSYLTFFYGDYMQLPPEDDRDHHHRLKVDFGKYI